MSHRLLRASAGTGKTFRLVAHYADLIETHGLSPSQIVAITFTKKAAGELRARIQKSLSARGATAATLQVLGRAPIGNFHSIALVLLEKLGVLPPHARETIRILGETGEDAALFREACQGAWLGGGREEKLAFAVLAPHFELTAALPDALWQALSRAREDDAGVSPTLFRSYAVGPRVGEASAQARGLQARLAAAGPELSPIARASAQAFVANWPTFDPEDSLETIQGKVEAGRRAVGHLNMRQPSLRRYVDKQERDALLRALGGIQAEIDVGALAAPFSQLVMSAWARYEARKRALGALDFVDLIAQLRAALVALSPEDFQARLGYRAVLIDEAQDTNRLQRQLVHALARLTPQNTSVQSVEDPSEKASLFVVGDWKQSIYTFRGADPQSFAQFADDVLSRAGVEETLTISRRSRSEVVAGINSLGAALFADAYEPLAPWPILDATRPPSALTPGFFWRALGDEEARGVFSAGPQKEAEAVAECVAAHLAAGTDAGEVAILVSGMTHASLFVDALTARRIAVTLGGGGGFFARPEVTDTIALLSWIFDPTLTLEAAVALRSPLFALHDDDLMWLMGPEGRAEERLAQLRDNSFQSLEAAASPVAAYPSLQPEKLSRAACIVAELCALASQAGAALLLARTQVLLAQRALCFLQPGGAQAAANVERLHEMAKQHDRRFGPCAERFVARLRVRQADGPDEALAPATEAARRAVTLTTVHQAKGLEFEVVVLPLLSASGRHDAPDVAWSRAQQELVFRPRFAREPATTERYAMQRDARREAEEAETRRRLYVAITRARTRVEFVGAWPRRLGRAGFAKWLGPWAEASPASLTLVAYAPAGEARGVTAPYELARDRAQLGARTAALASVGKQNDTAPLGALPRQVSVTALAREASEDASVASEKLWLQTSLLLEEEALEQPSPLTYGGAWYEAPLESNRLGDLAHQVLACLDDFRCDPRDEAFVDRGLERLGYASSDARLGTLREDLVAFLRSPLGRTLKKLPSDRRHHEWPFALKTEVGTKSVIMRGQIDLVAQPDEKFVVVDFKYAFARGEIAPYKLQLEAYAWALGVYLQSKAPIACALVYLKERDHVQWFEATQQTAEAIQKRLEQT